MSVEPRVISGWVLVGGEQAPGRRVRLRVADGPTTLAEGFSVPDGQFAVVLPPDREDDFVLMVEALGLEGEILGRQEMPGGRPAVLHLDQLPPADDVSGPALINGRASDLTGQVERLEASGHLPPGSFAVVDAAVGRLAWLDGLLEPAARATLGDLPAAALLRDALSPWAREIDGTQSVGETEDPADEHGVGDGTPAVVSAEALGALISGVLTAGRSLDEQLELADGLGAVLSARSWLEAMAQAAGNGDLPAMQTLMGARAPVSGVPTAKIPGVPAGGFPGSPGGVAGGKPKGAGIIKVHPTVSDVVARLRSPLVLPPSEEQRCLVSAAVEVAGLRAKLPSYTITALEPADACPGSVLTITGEDFGGRGSVVFPGTASEVPHTRALEWTDTRIRVVVPDGAGPGRITLSILDATLVRCGQVFTVFRPGRTDMSFDGGTASVTAFLLDGSSEPLRVEPGELVSVSCSVTTHPLARTRVWATLDGATIADFGTLPGGGYRHHDLTAPAAVAPVTCIVHLLVSGPCGEVHHQRTLTVAATPHLRVAHIEVSQGLQDAAHTVRLVTGRTTGVRAYLTSGLVGFSYTGGPDEVPNVTGTLYVERAGVVVGSIPAAAPVSVRAGYADSHRSGTPATLLFLVPGWLMDGDVTMRVTAKAAGLPGFGSAAPATSQSRTVRTERGGAVTVVRLRMRLTNPAHPAAQATEEDWRASAMGARDRYPIGDTGMTVGAPSTGDVLPTDHFLGKPAGWHDALDDLDDYADRFDDITSVYACIVPNLDYGPESLNGTAHHEYVFWPVLVNRRCFLSRSLLQATFAHEMAHTLGVGHAPCGKDVEGIDERLPGRTEPGVVGWRRSNGHLIPPDWPELMSYCTPPEGATTFAPPGGHGKGTGVYDDRWPSVALWDLLLDKLT